MATTSPAKMCARILRSDLCAFIHRSFRELNPQTPFFPNWHLEVLAAKLEDVRLGHCRRLIVSLPPRHLKSHAISISFSAWLLGHDPTKQVLSITYAQDLSDHLARSSRNLMSSLFYQALFDTRLSKNREAVSDFETTAGGFRLSTSVGGVLTGRGADVIILDDVLKADDALSEVRRKSVNDWFDNTARSRLNSQETGAIIIVMQRLHADDLVAHVQQSENWDVVSFPAIAEQDQTYMISTPYGIQRIERKAEDVLHEAILSRSRLETLRRSMTEYNFAAQYQQDPRPPSGVVVKRDWLKFYDSKEKPDRFDQVFQSWDTAVKNTELANYSVCTTWGAKNKKLYLIDVFRRKLEFPDLKRAVRQQAALHNPQIVLIEDKASGSSLIQELRGEQFSRVQAAPALDGDKVMRLRSQTAKFEGGFVLLPKDAPWLNTYLSEILAFPNSKFDDQVDSTVLALAWWSSKSHYAWTKEALEGYERLCTPGPYAGLLRGLWI